MRIANIVNGWKNQLKIKKHKQRSPYNLILPHLTHNIYIEAIRYNNILKYIREELGKMKKKIIIGSLLTVIILMILPSVSAVEFNTAVESNKAQILEQIKNIDFRELKEKLKNIAGYDPPEFLIKIIALLWAIGIIIGYLGSILFG